MKSKTMSFVIFPIVILLLVCPEIWAGGKKLPEQKPYMGVEEVFDRIQTNSFDPAAQVRFLPENVPS